jgi:hypothetical protein
MSGEFEAERRTATKSATLDDLHALEGGCAADSPLGLRDAAIGSILVTTAAPQR